MKKYFPYIIFFLFALGVTLPLFRPGFVFLLDMVFAPHLSLAQALQGGRVGSDFPLVVIIKLFSFVLPLEIIQKLILTLVLFLPAVFMFRLSKKYLSTAWATLAGLLYVANPWVFERFLAGHWVVLLGYAFFPLLVQYFLEYILEKRGFWKFAVLFCLFPLLSLHWAYMSVFFLLVLWAVNRFSASGSKTRSFGVKEILILLVLGLAANSFWFVGFFSGGSAFTAITGTDVAAYRTVADSSRGIWLTVISLYGFWNRDYVLPKDAFSFWWLVGLFVLGVSVLGGILNFKKKNVLAQTLLLLLIPIIFLAVGFSSPLTQPLTVWLYNHFPGFRGLRETDKITGLLAFAYAFLLPLGAEWISLSFANNSLFSQKISKAGVWAVFLLIPLFTAFYMLWGFGGQVKATPYPVSWTQADSYLKNDPTTQNVLFLPWWGYLRMPFENNNLVANPAPGFFNVNILAGKSFENIGIQNGQSAPTELDKKIADLLAGRTTVEEAIPFFESQHISHIILVQEEDTAKYGFLFTSAHLKRALTANGLVLFSVVP